MEIRPELIRPEHRKLERRAFRWRATGAAVVIVLALAPLWWALMAWSM